MRGVVVLAGLLLFAIGMGLHVRIWRKGRPERELLSLVLTFFAPWAAYTFTALVGMRLGPLWVSDWAAVSLLYWTLSGAYLQTYPVLQAASPSLLIVLAVGKAMPRGLSEEELLETLVDPQSQMADRIDDLLEGGLVTQDGGKLRLTKTSAAFIFPFRCLRALLGMELGRG
ncbi:MAG: hypothetical protein HY078_03890 [Elusimicrobia bacterium]|nr:hypothetical protein [Elusimicrobiota bacterium]